MSIKKSIVLAIFIILPMIVFCQHKVQTKTLQYRDGLNYPVKETKSFYYDDDDNEVLHGRQTFVTNFKGDGVVRNSNITENYYEGELDGAYSYRLYFKKHNVVQWSRRTTTTNDIYDECTVTGSFKKGKPDGNWNYSLKSSTKNPFSPENLNGNFTFTFNNGQLAKFSDRNKNNVTFSIIDGKKIDGHFMHDNKLLLNADNGIITNMYIRQGTNRFFAREAGEPIDIYSLLEYQKGVLIETNEELTQLINEYKQTQDMKTFLKSRYRLDSMTVYPLESFFLCCKTHGPGIGRSNVQDRYTVYVAYKIKWTPASDFYKNMSYGQYLPDTVRIKENYSFYAGGETYYIDPKDVDIALNTVEKVRSERLAQIEERKKQEEERKRKEEEKRIEEQRIKEEKQKREKEIQIMYETVENWNIKNLKTMTNEIYDKGTGRTTTYVKLSYTKTMESYSSICKELKINNFIGYNVRRDKELNDTEYNDLKKLAYFTKTFGYYIIEKNLKKELSDNKNKIEDKAKKTCKDVSKDYSNEYKTLKFVKSFDSFGSYETYMKSMANAITLQKQVLDFIEKREALNKTEEIIKKEMSSYKHLNKAYDTYKKSFDLSWSKDSVCFDRLKQFDYYQTECQNFIKVNKSIDENDKLIYRATKKYKNIEKAYSKYKKSCNLISVPLKDDINTLREFADFQTKLLSNITQSGDKINTELNKVKDIDQMKKFLQDK